MEELRELVQLSENQRDVIIQLLGKYTPVQVKLLLILSGGERTTKDVAEMLYGRTTEHELNVTHVHIHHLRKRLNGNVKLMTRYNNTAKRHTRFNRYIYYLASH